jgi:hypothetical protein
MKSARGHNSLACVAALFFCGICSVNTVVSASEHKSEQPSALVFTISAGEFKEIDLSTVAATVGDEYWAFENKESFVEHPLGFLELIQSPVSLLIDAYHGESGTMKVVIERRADQDLAGAVLERKIVTIQIDDVTSAPHVPLSEVEVVTGRSDGRLELKWIRPSNGPITILADGELLDIVYGGGYIADDSLAGAQRLRFVIDLSPDGFVDQLQPLELIEGAIVQPIADSGFAGAG